MIDVMPPPERVGLTLGVRLGLRFTHFRWCWREHLTQLIRDIAGETADGTCREIGNLLVG